MTDERHLAKAREWLEHQPHSTTGHSGKCKGCVDSLAALLARTEAGAVAKAEQERDERVRAEGFAEAREEAIQWAMAERRDDGTAQRIEEHLRALSPSKGEGA